MQTTDDSTIYILDVGPPQDVAVCIF